VCDCEDFRMIQSVNNHATNVTVDPPNAVRFNIPIHPKQNDTTNLGKDRQVHDRQG
jgi:hypothetical protein